MMLPLLEPNQRTVALGLGRWRGHSIGSGFAEDLDRPEVKSSIAVPA
jgi:hypothetical protein